MHDVPTLVQHKRACITIEYHPSMFGTAIRESLYVLTYSTEPTTISQVCLHISQGSNKVNYVSQDFPFLNIKL